MSRKFTGVLLVLVCVALWALIPVVAKLGQTTLDNHQFLFWSSLVSFVVLGGTALFAGGLSEVRTYTPRDWLSLGGLGLLGTYIYYLFLYFGYSQAAGIEVLVFQYTWPILIVVFSMIILKEKRSWQRFVAIFLGFAGVIVVLTRGDLTHISVTSPGAVALVAVGSACFALFSVLSKNIRHSPLPAVAIYFLSACLASFASMLLLSRFALPTPRELLPVLLNGVLVNGFSYVLWMMALKSADASYLAPLTYLTPVLSAVYLVIFFRESLLLAHGIGLACIIAGGLVNSIGDRQPGVVE